MSKSAPGQFSMARCSRLCTMPSACRWALQATAYPYRATTSTSPAPSVQCCTPSSSSCGIDCADCSWLLSRIQSTGIGETICAAKPLVRPPHLGRTKNAAQGESWCFCLFCLSITQYAFETNASFAQQVFWPLLQLPHVYHQGIQLNL